MTTLLTEDGDDRMGLNCFLNNHFSQCDKGSSEITEAESDVDFADTRWWWQDGLKLFPKQSFLSVMTRVHQNQK